MSLMQPDEEKLLREVLKLPDEARAAIAGKLVDSLDQTVDSDSEEAWAREIERRLAAIDAGKVKLVPWSVARKRLRDAAKAC